MLADIILAIGIICSKTTAYQFLSTLTVERWFAGNRLEWLWEYLVGGSYDEDIQMGPIFAAVLISSVYVISYFLGFWILVFWVTLGVGVAIWRTLEQREMERVFMAAMRGDEEARERLQEESGIYFFKEGTPEEEVDKFLEEKEHKK